MVTNSKHSFGRKIRSHRKCAKSTDHLAKLGCDSNVWAVPSGLWHWGSSGWVQNASRSYDYYSLVIGRKKRITPLIRMLYIRRYPYK